MFPNAEEGKCSDRSGCLRVGGASQAAIATVELTVPHRLWPRKKKKSLQLYVQGLLFAAVCYNTAWQPPGLSVFFLEEPGPRADDMATQPCSFAHSALCCSLSY